jgi:Fic family protein
MLNITYNISPKLNENLKKIEELRKQILLTPIPSQKELHLKWEAIVNRIHYSLKLSGNPMKKKDVMRFLSEPSEKRLTQDLKEIAKYKEALDYISLNWLASDKAVDADSILDLHRIIGTGNLRVPKAGLQHLLDYLQTRSSSLRSDDSGRAAGENPVLLAGVINIELEKMKLFVENNIEIAHLATDLFLYKHGYDFKGFLSYEAGWMEDEKYFKEIHERSLNAVSLTLWLEYFTENIAAELEKISQQINSPKTQASVPEETFWELNSRQKAILNLLSSPQSSITNRLVQKRFKISQITASRDLTKLSNLGCLLSHGKGRSVHYTKI